MHLLFDGEIAHADCAHFPCIEQLLYFGPDFVERRRLDSYERSVRALGEVIALWKNPSWKGNTKGFTGTAPYLRIKLDAASGRGTTCIVSLGKVAL